jgi:hypothetical protein
MAGAFLAQAFHASFTIARSTVLHTLEGGLRMRSTRRLLLALSVAALVPGVARADVHGWTLCTPSAFHSCHSVSIGTTPIMIGSTRVGTGITVSVTNLQGSGFLSDNTSLSGLFRVFFAGRNTGPMVNSIAPFNATMTGPGASGFANWTMETGTQNGTQTVGFTDGQPSINGAIGGCASGVLAFGFVTTANTCGTAAMAVFSFTSGSIFDAGQMETVFIAAAGPTDSDFDFCFSDPSAAPDPGFPACDVQSEFVTTVTPEPVSIALMGTGLFGIGGARLRRRRKTADQI